MDQHLDVDAPGLLGQLVALAGATVLLALAFGSVSRTHRQRLHAKPQPLPERLQVWEGEGGQNQMADLP